MSLHRELTAFDVNRAIRFAEKHHKGQIRHGNGLPYISHPLAVSYLVAAYKSSKYIFVLLVAAILHDVLEDSKQDKDRLYAEIVREFGAQVAALLLELTNDDAQIDEIGKLAYHKKKLVGLSSWALVIKLADRLHNISDKPTRKMLHETLELMAHLRKSRKLTKTHLELVKDIELTAQDEITRREDLDRQVT